MILASQSPRRQELLSEAGLEYRCIPAHIDESAIHDDDPARLVMALARAKAHAVADQALPGEPVIGSDTVVACDGAVLGKPKDPDDARSMLRALSGKTHQVHTGVCVCVDGDDPILFTETTDVTFWELDEREIDRYVDSGEPMDKAGAYGIQGKGRILVRSIAGDYYTVVGFPIARLVRSMRAAGLIDS